MKLSLPQHIYTCGFSFETVAETPGISKEIRSRIESYAGIYPRSLNETDPPPLVFRAFPLSDKGKSSEKRECDWGIMLMMHKGSDLSGRQGNYLAHSFIIAKEDLARLGWNLPWIAAHLPIWADFTSYAHGVQPLDFKEVDIDPQGQFTLLELLLDILPEEEYYTLMYHLMKSLETPIIKMREETNTQSQGLTRSGTFSLSLGPPPPNLQALVQAHLGVKTPPIPDAWNLWRTAALFALVPVAFQKRADFSINETDPNSSSKIKYTLTILRIQSKISLSLEDTSLENENLESTRAYLKYCLDQLSKDGSEGYSKISRLIKGINIFVNSASLAELGAGFNYCCIKYKQEVLSDPRSQENIEGKYLSELMDLQGSRGNLNLIRDAVDYLKRVSINPNPGVFKILKYIAETIFSENEILYYDIAEEIIKFYALRISLSYDEKLDFFNSLSDQVRLRWWLESERNKLPPAYLINFSAPEQQPSISDIELVISLTETIYNRLAPNKQKNFIERVRIALNKSSIKEDVKCTGGFLTLLDFISSSSYYPSLISDLIREIAWAIESCTTGFIDKNMYCNNALLSIRERVYSPNFIDKSNNTKWEMIGEFSDYILSVYVKDDRLGSRQSLDAIKLLLTVPEKQKQRDASITFLGKLQPRRWSIRYDLIGLLINCQIELLEATLQRYQLNNQPRYRDIILPKYREWMEHWKKSRRWFTIDNLFDRLSVIFHKNVCDRIKDEPLDIALPIGICYLMESYGMESIFRGLVLRFLKDDSEKVAKWLDNDCVETGNRYGYGHVYGYGYRYGTVSSIMLFTKFIKMIYNSKYRNYRGVEDAKYKIQEIINSQLWGRMDVTRRLKEYFKQMDIPISILKSQWR